MILHVTGSGPAQGYMVVVQLPRSFVPQKDVRSVAFPKKAVVVKLGSSVGAPFIDHRGNISEDSRLAAV